MRDPAFRLVLILAFLASLSLALWQGESDLEQLVDYDVGSHMIRSIRVYHILMGRTPADLPGGWASWAGFMGDYSQVHLEGNFYPPLMHLVGGLWFRFAGPSSAAGAALLVPAFFLLIAAAGGFARPLGPSASIAAAAMVAASPAAFVHGRLFLVDLPLAAAVGLSLWMLVASDGFRRPGPTWLLGVFLGLGCLVKSTFWLFTAPPVAVALLWLAGECFPTLADKRRALIPTLKALGLVVAVGYVVAIPLGRVPSPSEQAWKAALAALACPAAALFLLNLARRPAPAESTGEVEENQEAAEASGDAVREGPGEAPAVEAAGASPSELEERWRRVIASLALGGALAGPYNLMMAPSLAGGLANPNPLEPAGLQNVPEAFLYYLSCLAFDHLLLPFFLLAPVGLVLACRRPAWRHQALLAALSLGVSTLFLGYHGARLARYTLAHLVPLAWFAAAALAALPRARRHGALKVVVACALAFNASWWVADRAPGPWAVFYHVWGNRSRVPLSWLPPVGFPGFPTALPPPTRAPLHPVLPTVFQEVEELLGPQGRQVLFCYTRRTGGTEENLHGARLKLEAERRRVPWTVLEVTEDAVEQGLVPADGEARGTVMLLAEQGELPPQMGPYRLAWTVEAPPQSHVGVYVPAEGRSPQTGTR